MTESSGDTWSQWLLQRRFGSDEAQLRAAMAYLAPIRERVLQNARLAEHDALLDVGAGDGLITFGALAQAPTCRVIFSDISQDLLDHAAGIAQELGMADRCRFLNAAATDLSALPDASIDVVTTRSVLIYVADKQQAFHEFARVLKPGGRLSIFEPINRFAHPEPEHRFWGYDVTPVHELTTRLKAVYRRRQPLDSDPMLDFDERDLLTFAERAGFTTINLELQAQVAPPQEPVRWDVFIRIAGNPKIPTLEEALHEALEPGERERFVAHLRPLVESQQAVRRSAVAYLWAAKSLVMTP